jgi:glutaredoxin
MEYNIMEYEVPTENGYTIYSKSGCPNCTKAKKLLISENVDVIDCDEYLLDDKEEFLSFMSILIGKDYRMFPMIFKNSVFIGGYTELQKYYLQNKVQIPNIKNN